MSTGRWKNRVVKGAKRQEVIAADQRAERRRTIAGLLCAGVLQSEIARRLGLTNSTICEEVKLIREEWRQSTFLSYGAHVEQEQIRLDAMLRAVWPAAYRGEVDAVKVVLKIHTARCRLLGLGAQPLIEVNVGPDVALGAMAKLEELTRAMAAANGEEWVDGQRRALPAIERVDDIEGEFADTDAEEEPEPAPEPDPERRPAVSAALAMRMRADEQRHRNAELLRGVEVVGMDGAPSDRPNEEDSRDEPERPTYDRGIEQ